MLFPQFRYLLAVCNFGQSITISVLQRLQWYDVTSLIYEIFFRIWADNVSSGGWRKSLIRPFRFRQDWPLRRDDLRHEDVGEWKALFPMWPWHGMQAATKSGSGRLQEHRGHGNQVRGGIRDTYGKKLFYFFHSMGALPRLAAFVRRLQLRGNLKGKNEMEGRTWNFFEAVRT